ncbi:hypothetical protein [Nocardioides pakistanensis]
MPDLSALDGAILDDDGYPTEAALALIPTWTGTPKALVTDLLTPVFEGYGGIQVIEATDDFDRPVVRIRLVTGGWSGCESAVGDLQRGLFWVAWWRESRRGGAYTFEVPVAQWEAPMVEWPRHRSDYAQGWSDAASLARAVIGEVRDDRRLPQDIAASLDRLDQVLTDGLRGRA